MTNQINIADRGEDDAQVSKPFNPDLAVYPKPGTQTSMVLATLLKGHEVNPLYSWRALGTYRLSDAVHRLSKKLGWPIDSDEKEVINVFGDPCCHGLYSLPRNVIAAAGEAGQKFANEVLALMRIKRRRAFAFGV